MQYTALGAASIRIVATRLVYSWREGNESNRHRTLQNLNWCNTNVATQPINTIIKSECRSINARNKFCTNPVAKKIKCKHTNSSGNSNCCRYIPAGGKNETKTAYAKAIALHWRAAHGEGKKEQVPGVKKTKLFNHEIEAIELQSSNMVEEPEPCIGYFSPLAGFINRFFDAVQLYSSIFRFVYTIVSHGIDSGSIV